MSAAFSRQQIKKLVTPLDPSHIKMRDRGGKSFAYVEGWFAVSQANAIFGYAGWDREMAQFDRLFETKEGAETVCGYLARVRITVRAGGGLVVREGTGFGEAKSLVRAEAHERALKASETDATKRALVTFGARFGLSLYDKDQGWAVCPVPGRQPPQHYVLYDETGAVLAAALSAEGFCSGLRQVLESCHDAVTLTALVAQNRKVLVRLREARPELRSRQGHHFADILERLAARRLMMLGTQSQPEENHLSRQGREPSTLGTSAPVTLSAPIVAGGHSRKVGPNGVQNDEGHKANLKNGLRVAVKTPDKTENQEHLPDPVESENSPACPQYQAAPIGDGDLVGAKTKPHSGGIVATAQTAPTASGLHGEASSGEQRGHGAMGDSIVSSAKADPPAETSNGARATYCADGLRPSKIGAGPAIDKSCLAIKTTKRIRNKAHLLLVASEPCLICGDRPCHAHHLAFAQPRGLSLKVSDEFTVPLCAIHHNALHSHHQERAFWRLHRIDPLPIAETLWKRTTQSDGALER